MRCVGKHEDGGSCPFEAVREVAGVNLCGGHLRRLAAEIVPEGGVVYYMGCPDRQLVKIGTTSNLLSRWRVHRAQHPKLVVLATEPGRYDLETRRHRQFSSLRSSTVSREWFRKAPVLMEHIAALRARHGIVLPSPHPLPAHAVAPVRG